MSLNKKKFVHRIPKSNIVVDYWEPQENDNTFFRFMSFIKFERLKCIRECNYRIYTSRFNCWYLRTYFQISKKRLMSLELNKTKKIYDPNKNEYFRVTALEANYCVGSTMFLFQGMFGNVLYTGFFRPSITHDIFEVPVLKEIIRQKNMDVVFIDNTYAAEYCKFPTRAEVIKEIINIIRENPNHKIIISMKFFEKIEILKDIISTVNETICVSPEKYNLLNAIGIRENFTKNDEDCRIIVFDYIFTLHQCCKMLQKYGKCFILLLTAFYDCQEPELKSKSQINIPGLYILPYSGHSSHSELMQFISVIQPHDIKPIMLTNNKSSKLPRCMYDLCYKPDLKIPSQESDFNFLTCYDSIFFKNVQNTSPQDKKILIENTQKCNESKVCLKNKNIEISHSRNQKLSDGSVELNVDNNYSYYQYLKDDSSSEYFSSYSNIDVKSDSESKTFDKNIEVNKLCYIQNNNLLRTESSNETNTDLKMTTELNVTFVKDSRRLSQRGINAELTLIEDQSTNERKIKSKNEICNNNVSNFHSVNIMNEKIQLIPYENISSPDYKRSNTEEPNNSEMDLCSTEINNCSGRNKSCSFKNINIKQYDLTKNLEFNFIKNHSIEKSEKMSNFAIKNNKTDTNFEKILETLITNYNFGNNGSVERNSVTTIIAEKNYLVKKRTSHFMQLKNAHKINIDISNIFDSYKKLINNEMFYLIQENKLYLNKNLNHFKVNIDERNIIENIDIINNKKNIYINENDTSQTEISSNKINVVTDLNYTTNNNICILHSYKNDSKDNHTKKKNNSLKTNKKNVDNDLPLCVIENVYSIQKNSTFLTNRNITDNYNKNIQAKNEVMQTARSRKKIKLSKDIQVIPDSNEYEYEYENNLNSEEQNINPIKNIKIIFDSINKPTKKLHSNDEVILESDVFGFKNCKNNLNFDFENIQNNEAYKYNSKNIQTNLISIDASSKMILSDQRVETETDSIKFTLPVSDDQDMIYSENYSDMIPATPSESNVIIINNPNKFESNQRYIYKELNKRNHRNFSKILPETDLNQISIVPPRKKQKLNENIFNATISDTFESEVRKRSKNSILNELIGKTKKNVFKNTKTNLDLMEKNQVLEENQSTADCQKRSKNLFSTLLGYSHTNICNENLTNGCENKTTKRSVNSVLYELIKKSKKNVFKNTEKNLDLIQENQLKENESTPNSPKRLKKLFNMALFHYSLIGEFDENLTIDRWKNEDNENILPSLNVINTMNIE